MRKKKVAVLHAQVPFVRGGAELHVQALCENLRKWGYDAELIQMPYKWYPQESLYDSMMSWRMIDLSESNGEKIDLVIGTKFPSYGAIHENKVTWVIHQFRQVYDLYDTENGYSRIPHGADIQQVVKRYDERCLKESRAVFANSKTVADRLSRYNKIPSTPLYHPPALVGRYETGDSLGYILSVGRLDALKRNDLLIRSAAQTKNISVKIAGRGPEMDHLKALARKLRVEDRVEFLGFVPDEDLLKLYAGALAVYFAPIDEDYGYITLEAFLSQKPVITCFDSGGPLEFVVNGKNGFICNPQPEEIAAAMLRFREKPEMAKAFGQAGREAVKDISWDHVIDELTKTIR